MKPDDNYLDLLNDELLVVQSRLLEAEKEAKPIIKKQIREIKRDIQRNSKKTD